MNFFWSPRILSILDVIFRAGTLFFPVTHNFAKKKLKRRRKKHKTQQQKTILGSICKFLEPLLQFWIVCLTPSHLNFFCSLDLLCSSAPQDPNKTARTKMYQDKHTKLWRRCRAEKSSFDALTQLSYSSLQFRFKSIINKCKYKHFKAFELWSLEFYNSNCHLNKPGI